LRYHVSSGKRKGTESFSRELGSFEFPGAFSCELRRQVRNCRSRVRFLLHKLARVLVSEPFHANSVDSDKVKSCRIDTHGVCRHCGKTDCESTFCIFRWALDLWDLKPAASKPPHVNFAGICVCCGNPGCKSTECISQWNTLHWIICPVCGGEGSFLHEQTNQLLTCPGDCIWGVANA